MLRDDILQQALQLPPADRVFVLDALDRSLSDAGFATAEIASAWNEELDRRIEAHDRGDILAVGIERAMLNLRQHLSDHRAQKAKS